MSDLNGIKLEPHISINLGKSPMGKGGNGGPIMIVAETLTGTGEIITDGGDGRVGGNAGKINIQVKHNKFKGKISAKGGKGRG